MIDKIENKMKEQGDNIKDWTQGRFDLDGLSYKGITIDIDNVNIQDLRRTILMHIDSDIENTAYDIGVLDGMIEIYKLIKK